ncbi:hypothetical protein [Acidianus manzaensis]|uniref:Uncharacterized protein n=1 Tax=Acidianus manzaensis TaxID=282676 RepID=A0A1W6K2X1_9CREN|nr:hypothetical protein [Acidianus manzaensis]ARM76794.1 hypothetical protein B6F84_12715 [Acidianus manzaensis]
MVGLEPGITPLPIIVAYFIIAVGIAFFIIKKSSKKLNAIDLAIVGVGGALVAIADHIVGDAIFLPSGIYPIINPPVWFRIFVFFIVIGAVRKVGSGMLTMAVFDIVGDLIHFSFVGEPLWLIEDVFTYGLMADIVIFLTGGKIFAIGEKLKSRFDFLLISALEGGALGFFFSFVHPFFTYGFIAPEVFGFVPDQAEITYLFVTYIPGDILIGAISAIIANRISKVIR